MFITNKSQEIRILVNRMDLADPWLNEAIFGKHEDLKGLHYREVEKRLAVWDRDKIFASYIGRGFTIRHVGSYMTDEMLVHLDILEFIATKVETNKPTIVNDCLVEGVFKNRSIEGTK